MDILRIKASGSEVLVRVRNVGRTDHQRSCFRLELLIADGELSPPLDDVEHFVIRMHMQVGPCTNLICAVTNNHAVDAKFRSLLGSQRRILLAQPLVGADVERF